MNATAEGSRYQVNIEGTIHAWNKGSISVAEIRELGGFPPNSPVVAVDLTDNSRTPLPEDATHDLVALESGKPLVKRMCFAKG
jgi:hypothetical protein